MGKKKVATLTQDVSQRLQAPDKPKTSKRGADDSTERKDEAATPAKKPKREDIGATKKRQVSMMTRSEFLKKAQKLEVNVGSKQFKVDPRQFSTSSVGFFYSGKVPVTVGGDELIMQCTLNMFDIGSKEW